MSVSWKTTAGLTLLALVFAIGLTFAAVELPRLLDDWMGNTVNTPALATGQDMDTAYKTRLYMDHFHLKVIGYAALAITLLLIVVGLARNRTGLASAGAILLFLPVFGQFAATMFFLGGLAFLRLLWLPFLDLSFNVMRLGDAILFPYRWMIDLGRAAGIALHGVLPPVFVATGFFFFVAGTLAWFLARARGRKVADFWVYRISRHPQYLGWIIWSYGILLLPGNNQKRYFELSNTLPWLLSTLVIIGVALFEEMKMRKSAGTEYCRFQQRTPFLFPLPRFILRLLKWPQRLLFGKNRFERKREILAFLGLYALVFMGISLWSSGLLAANNPVVAQTSSQIRASAETIRNTTNRLLIRRELKSLAGAGTQALPHLLSLLADEDPIVRWYTIDTLGEMGSIAAVPDLIARLRDPDRWVRTAAAGALGRLQARTAVPALIEALADRKRDMAKAAALALGRMKDRRAIAPLLYVLQRAPTDAAGAAASALGNMGFRDTTPTLVQCLEERADCPFNQVGEALFELGSPRALDAFAAGLKDKAWWQRETALRGMAALGTPAALSHVISALDDPDTKVRRTAVWVMRRFSATLAPRIRQALESLQSDPDLEVRLYAIDTLEYFGDGKVKKF
ncbi:MAG: HEAT repeat domain-containing protein [Candidatus Aminicenantes bacterium]|nr:HEAT repeat domain-containing protein [Candidatus Aminicenantes bacterium]